MFKMFALTGVAACLMSAPAIAQNSQPSPALSPATQKLAEQVREKQKEVVGETRDIEMRAKAEEMIAKAEKFLRSRQDKATGGWSVPTVTKEGASGPLFPAFTALVLDGLLMDPKADPEKDPTIKAGVKFLLDHQQPDGGIYERDLPQYNTSLAVSALSKVHTPRAREAVEKGVKFLKSIQWGEQADPTVGGKEASKPVTRDHPFYGGVGYGSHSRPDNSNLVFFMQALQDAGVSPQDEAVKRAVVFLQRTQMDDRVNDQQFAKGSRQGGFVYSTVEDAKSVEERSGSSEAGTIEETLSDGTTASRLRCYGSMTYAGFKSYIYAEIPKTDPRMQYAYDWIRRNYTVDENPGIGSNGQYYYYVIFARALKAWGEPTVKTLSAKNELTGQEHAWRSELIEKLASLQNEDGSFKSFAKRWMEANPDLITAYALIALRQAIE
jgi:squalene-hopene/tetraprenyl-beta-curcumene cyclase